jgi:hypothetical protein
VTATQNDSPSAPFPQAAAARYALVTSSFRFRALASLAGRAPLGGEREVALAMYLLARLVDDCRPVKALSRELRVTRSTAARSWLANTALPPAIRGSLARLAESTEGDPPAIISALSGAILSAAAYLDSPSRLELERLARAIGQ